MTGMATSHVSELVETREIRISDYLRNLRRNYQNGADSAESSAVLTPGMRDLCAQVLLCYEVHYSSSPRTADISNLGRLRDTLESEVRMLSSGNDLENPDTRSRLMWYLPQALAYKMDQALGILSTESLS